MQIMALRKHFQIGIEPSLNLYIAHRRDIDANLDNLCQILNSAAFVCVDESCPAKNVEHGCFVVGKQVVHMRKPPDQTDQLEQKKKLRRVESVDVIDDYEYGAIELDESIFGLVGLLCNT